MKALVLLATYNGEKYLQQQLDSLYNQNNVDVEILARDDGSTDSTLNILRSNSINHNLHFYTGSHLNVAKGYLDLMRKAESSDAEYYAFCDQDDVWDSDKLSVGIKTVMNIDKPALYYCGQRLVDANLKLIANHTLNKQRSLHTRFVLSDFAGCTGVFNKELLRKVNEYAPNYVLMHDTWILKVCLAVGGKVIVDPAVHMCYRQHGGNTVGLGRSLPAYLKQVKQYLNEYKVQPQMEELIRGYDTQIIPEYRRIADACCNYKKNRVDRDFLLDKKNFDFCSKGLNLTFYLKIMINKL